jgi:hypothetical protein
MSMLLSFAKVLVKSTFLIIFLMEGFQMSFHPAAELSNRLNETPDAGFETLNDDEIRSTYTLGDAIPAIKEDLKNLFLSEKQSSKLE